MAAIEKQMAALREANEPFANYEKNASQTQKSQQKYSVPEYHP